MSKVTDEIDEMLGTLTETRETSEEEIIEGPIEGSVEGSNDAPEDKPEGESTDRSVDDEEEVVEEKEEEDVEEPDEKPTEDLEDKDSVIEGLRKQVEELSARKPEPEPEPESKSEPEKPKATEPFDFMGDLDLEDLFNDKDALNNLLNKVYQRGVETASLSAEEKVLRNIPSVIRANIAMANDMKSTTEQFYKDNADLAPFKNAVGAVFEELAAKSPDKMYKDLLGELATETRKRLNLHKKTVEKDSERHPRLPAKKGGVGRGGEKPDLSSVEGQLDAMNKVVRR